MPCGPRAACSTHHRFAKLCLGMRRSPPHSSHSEKNKSRPAKGRKGKTASMTDHAVIVPSAGRTLGSYLYDPKFRGIFFQILTLIVRSEEHTSELQSLMRISYAVFCLKKNNITDTLIHGKKT